MKRDMYATISNWDDIAAVIDDGLVVYDRNGRLVWCNQTFQGFYGYTDSQVAPGTHYSELGKIDVANGTVVVGEDFASDDAYLRTKAAYRASLSGSFIVQLKSGLWLKTADRRLPDGGFISIQTDITELIKAKAAAESNQWLLSAALQGGGLGTWSYSFDTAEFTVDDGLAALLGYAVDELRPMPWRRWTKFIHQDDLQRLNEAVEEHVQGQSDMLDMEARQFHKSGAIVWLHIRGKVRRSPGEQGTRAIYGTVQDISEKKRAEEQLRLFEQVVMTTKEGIYISDAAGRITYANEAFEQLVGSTIDQFKGLYLRDIPAVSQLFSPQEFEQQVTEIEESGFASAEFNFSETSVWAVVYAIYDDNGTIANRAGFMRDISAKKEYEQRLEHLAYTDSLTGLVNRAQFERLLEWEIGRHQRSDQQMALLYLDLDDFKKVNDSHGHAFGDRVLKDVAARLRSLLRNTDIISRRGGDEFTVLLTQVSASESVKRICDSLINGVAGLSRSAQGHNLGATIGVAMFPQDSKDPEQLQIYADRAMYAAKAAGKNCVKAYSKRMHQQWEHRRNTEVALKQALANNRLELYFQPIVDLQTHSIVGAEALLRWFHGGSFIPPAEFIPIAEASGLILDIDMWVLDQACSRLMHWRKELQTTIDIHVNLSAQFVQEGNVDAVSRTLEQHALEGQAICLEITETAVISDIDIARTNVMALQELGLTVGLDDFGTGYSSLNHLTAFPIDVLKIDREFISKSDDDLASQVIVEAVTAMARRLGNDVIAEGVETETQRDFALQSGCRFAQGYFLGRPCPADEFMEKLRPT
jgi:diguanylate cyclase (GGDEF)-like protein/PAS domain S-box-containing protein